MSFEECNCDQDGSDGGCNNEGKCYCWPVFDGDKCNKCAKGYFEFPKCQSIHFFQLLQIIRIFSLSYIFYVFYRLQL